MDAGQKRKMALVRVMDIEKRRVPTKHYVFVLEITWADGTQNVVYRRYSQFFTLQTSLIDAFPIEGGVKNPADRILPFIPGKVLFRSHVREVALKRKAALDEYCKKLIKLPQNILQCEHIISFFEPTQEDIGNLTDSLKRATTQKVKGAKKAETISDPVLLEQYIALADFKKCGKGQIGLVAGDVVEVIEKSDNGWFFVCLEDEQGWVPCSYLEPAQGTQEEEVMIEKCTVEEKFVCVKPYTKSLDDEIDLELGAIVNVLQKGSDGWWQVRYRGQEGWAPRAHLKSAVHLNLGTQTTDMVRDRDSLKIKGAKLGVAAPPRRRTVKRTVVARSTRRPTPNHEAEEVSAACEYVASANYQFKVGNKNVNISEGTSYTVIEKAPNGWSLVKIGQEEGWVPSSLLDRRRKGEHVTFEDQEDMYANVRGLTITEVPKSDIEVNNNDVTKRQEKDSAKEECVTIGAYITNDETGVSFREGMAVEVLEKNDSGWWFIRVGAKEGWAPSTYLKVTKKATDRRSIISGNDSMPGILQIAIPPSKPNRKSEIPQSYENVGLTDECTKAPEVQMPPIPRPRVRSSTSGSEESGGPSPVDELREAFKKRASPIPSPRGGPRKVISTQSFDERSLGSGPGRGPTRPAVPGLRKISEPTKPPQMADLNLSPNNMKRRPSPPAPNRPATPKARPSPPIPDRPNNAPVRHIPAIPEGPKGELFVTLSDYTDSDDGMLSFKAGVKVQVLEKDDGGWWLAMIGVKKGWVPSNYLRKL